MKPVALAFPSQALCIPPFITLIVNRLVRVDRLSSIKIQSMTAGRSRQDGRDECRYERNHGSDAPGRRGSIRGSADRHCCGLTYRNTSVLNEDAGWVAHTNQVLDLTAEVLLALVDAETGQRGFLLTGRQEYLEPYSAAVQRLDGLLSTLKYETRDNTRNRIGWPV